MPKHDTVLAISVTTRPRVALKFLDGLRNQTAFYVSPHSLYDPTVIVDPIVKTVDQAFLRCDAFLSFLSL